MNTNGLKVGLVGVFALAGVTYADDGKIKRMDIGKITDGYSENIYTRKDGLYMLPPMKSPNGHDVVCFVYKDTEAVLNLQKTPQALAQGGGVSCIIDPPKGYFLRSPNPVN